MQNTRRFPLLFGCAMESLSLLRKSRLLGLAVVAVALMTAVAQPSWQAPLGERMVYKTVNGRELSLYVLQPLPATAAPHPAIVFFHGGGWVKGTPAQFNPQAQFLAARGMVAIQVEYRLIAAQETPQVCVEDAKSAVRWVREHAAQLHIDPNKIVESGGSAGGYMAAFATMVPGWDDPQDNLAVSPRADLLVLFNPVIDNSESGFGYARFGAGYKKYSPIFYTSAHTPPMLILSGAADKLIHASALQTFQQNLEQAGVAVQLKLYPGAGHGFFGHEPYRTQTTQAMAEFLRQHGYLSEQPDAAQAAGASPQR